jgi:intracellular sulfur oxidation DsrE/DsrF family protein
MKTSKALHLISFLVFLFLGTSLQAQQWITPAIEGYGPIIAVDTPEGAPKTNQSYTLIYDLADGKLKDGVNFGLWKMARMINLLHQGGVSKADIKIVGVIHGGATDIILQSEHYKAKHQTENPNITLIQRLTDYGVRLYFCKQGATSRKITDAMALPVIMPAVSAMTVIANYQLKGYVLMP